MIPPHPTHTNAGAAPQPLISIFDIGSWIKILSILLIINIISIVNQYYQVTINIFIMNQYYEISILFNYIISIITWPYSWLYSWPIPGCGVGPLANGVNAKWGQWTLGSLAKPNTV